jgi:hypothetical protein
LTFWRRIESLSMGEEIKKDYSHEIATSYNTFLAMTFHKTKAQDDKIKCTPPLTPLNGGIHLMIFTG